MSNYKRNRAWLAALAVGLMACTAAQANLVLFSDDFNNENGGNAALNYKGFTHWNVTHGSVDLIGAGSSYDLLSGMGLGLYVDMDGTMSPPTAGRIETKNSFTFDPARSYLLSFNLAGSQRTIPGHGTPPDYPDSVTVQVALGSVWQETYTLNALDGLQYISVLIQPTVETVGKLSFAGTGGDNVGLLLDNVTLAVIPAPGAALLAFFGLGLVGWVKRRMA